ncbi:MAG: C-terminal binding protein [Bacteroidales bacterium]
MNNIVVLDTGYPSYDYEKKLFRSHGYDISICGEEERDRKIGFAVGATGVLVRGTLLDAEALDRMKNLKAIVRYGTGFDNIDLKHAALRGIRVANVQDYASDSVSDHAMGLMYSCIRGIGTPWPEDFGKPVRHEVFELHDKILGIIGFGRIGSRLSRKAAPLFKKVLAYDPYKQADQVKEAGAITSGWLELLQNSHVISVHCNLTDETRHMLNGKAFNLMLRHPVILNTARGAVIDSAALLGALEGDRIHSAGLDVYEREPPGPEEKQLLSHPRVVATPHVAWYSETALAELQKRAADHLLALLQGKEVADEITPSDH